jgi:ubiquinone/menaquinone biosynthesis C-methylase UbiE
MEATKVVTTPPNVNHADYVRAEWEKFHREKKPLQRFASRIVPKPRRVLDVGCGAGQELFPYLEAVAAGVDLRLDALVAGRSLFGARAPFLLCAAAESLPFRNASFDVLLCRLALPYTDVRRALAEMARVLAPNGALVLQIHHLRYYLRRALQNPKHALAVIVRGLIFELSGRQPKGEVFQLVSSLRRMLNEAGFDLIEIDQTDRAAPVVLARRTD